MINLFKYFKCFNNSKFIVLVLIFLLGIVTICINTSHIFFNVTDIFNNVGFFTGTLNYKLENDELVNNSIVIGSSNEVELTLTLTSKNWIDSNYELYYLIDGMKTVDEDIEIGYTEDSIDKIKGTIKAWGKKKITLRIKNKSDKSVKITFGCEGSETDKEVILTQGNTLNNLMLNNNTILAYTYVGSGTKPSTFPNLGEGYHVTNLSCTGGTASWDNETWKMKILSTTGTSLVCNATVTALYKDNSGAAIPIIKGDLVPVKISDTGVVTKANLYEKWYDYDAKTWANAVILNNGYGPYANGATIPEEAIESYFVWIPRYRYKIFNSGMYSSLTSVTSAEKEIEIQFETKKTTITGDITLTPGQWLPHPAFTAFDVDGMWVGKFESGHRYATTTAEGQQNIRSSDYLVIKPNVYSWRGISVGVSFENSYNYNRYLDSHMMKNTEWGAVAYLSHSKYGYVGRIRVNNNKKYVTGYAASEEPTKTYNSGTSIAGNRIGNQAPNTDGTYTYNYLNTASVVASTTGNYSGIYDMSGGSWEYVMASANSTEGSTGLTDIISDFFTNSKWDKYYDKYTSTSIKSFSSLIFGDATGELGPFANKTDLDSTARPRSSWYNGWAKMIDNNGWFIRGAAYSGGITTTIFSFYQNSGSSDGGATENNSFRVVLTPQY